MRLIFALACLSACNLNAAVAPIYHLDAQTIAAFDDYIAKFERDVVAPWTASGKLWMDDRNCCVHNKAFENGKTMIEPRENADVASGSIHHFTGAMHIDGANIDDVRKIMEDYAEYPKNFTPDVSKATGIVQPDSTPADEHYNAHIVIETSTLWINLTYDCLYDTHYRRLDESHWMSKSKALSIREMREQHDPSKGYFPEGDDHGFLWRTNTYWFVRQDKTGIDLEVDSITVSRPVPTGFGWWGTRRTQSAVEKMLRDLRTAVNGILRSRS